jgi:hypothetical protein
MPFRSVAARKTIVRMVGAMTVAAVVIARAQSPEPAASSTVRLPDESAGLDGIATALVSAFDQADIVALGEMHQRKLDSDLRIAVVRHPDFATRVRFIVVEFGSTTEQSTLDRYIRGENLPRTQLEKVWRTTTQARRGDPVADAIWDDPIYADFFAAVREVNSTLPADARVRVLGGDPGPGDNRSRDAAAFAVLKEQVLQKSGKALVIYGAGHFWRRQSQIALSRSGGDVGLATMLEIEYPGRTLVVIPLGSVDPRATIDSASGQKLDRALTTPVRPVLVSLRRLPFRDFTAEEFIGSQVLICGGPGPIRPRGPGAIVTRPSPGSCRSIFLGSPVTLGQVADAVVYFGGGADVDSRAEPARER